MSRIALHVSIVRAAMIAKSNKRLALNRAVDILKAAGFSFIGAVNFCDDVVGGILPVRALIEDRNGAIALVY